MSSGPDAAPESARVRLAKILGLVLLCFFAAFLTAWAVPGDSGPTLGVLVFLALFVAAADILWAIWFQAGPREGTLDGIVKDRGVVARTLSPVGTVRIGNEHWTAEALDGSHLAEGTEVVVCGREGLRVLVRPADSLS